MEEKKDYSGICDQRKYYDFTDVNRVPLLDYMDNKFVIKWYNVSYIVMIMSVVLIFFRGLCSVLYIFCEIKRDNKQKTNP